jgi:hypothetical protein
VPTSSEHALLRPAHPAARRPRPLPPELARALVGVRTYDGLAECLRTLRAMAGEPSYAEIVRRIALHRAARPGGAAPERLPGRVTVYDCFRPGRRRMDADLVAEVVRALDADPGPWRAALADTAAARASRPRTVARRAPRGRV